ncbi:MAG: hypothetical protein ACRDUX_05260, partial [Mycobacterium sp.]
MSTLRSVWLGSHLLDDPSGAAAHADAHALGSPVHHQLLQAGDGLAAISAVLAQRYYRRAAAAWTTFGADGFARWVELGTALAVSEPVCRDGAMAFFNLAPAGFGRGGVETAAAWVALGRELASTSAKLAALFFRGTAPLLRKPGGLARLRPWVDVGRGLYGQHGWQGEFLAQAYFASAPQATAALHATAYQLWAGAAAALYPAIKERDFFGHLDRAVKDWSAEDQALFLRTTLSLAPMAAKEAFAFYRDLPASLAGLDGPQRTALLGVLWRTGKRLAGAAADLAPVAGVLLRQVPAAHALEALAQVDTLAAACPDAVVAALRSLPRVYEEAEPPQVRAWFASGLALARDNHDAGMAYFALESRTSLKILHATSTAATLEEVQGLLRKYVQMLSGAPANLRALDALRLRPPLEECPAENEIALPLRIDQLPTHEDNLRVYRFLAAQLAGRREFGTYAFGSVGGVEDPDAPPGGALLRYLTAPERPEAVEELFLLAEGVRIHHRLCADYRGLVGEGRWVADHVLARWAEAAAQSRAQRLDAVFLLILRGAVPGPLPEWVDEEAAGLIARVVAPLAAPSATVQDSMQAAEALAGALARLQPAYVENDRELDGFLLDKITGDALLDQYGDEDDTPASQAPWVQTANSGAEPPPAPLDLPLELSQEPDDGQGGAVPISPEELKRLLESGANLRITQGAGSEVEGVGLFITDLIGKIPSDQLDELRQLVGAPEDRPRRAARHFRDETSDGSY